MPWILNVALSDVRVGFHKDAGPNSMLIQIVDCGMECPMPKSVFKEIHQFEFLDIEEKDFALEEEMRCSHEQAAELVRLLKHALEEDMNVIVHCVAGVCRSGAVAEVGIALGFTDCQKYRSPNLLVKHRMMKALGWTYDPNEEYTLNGKPMHLNEWGLYVPVDE